MSPCTAALLVGVTVFESRFELDCLAVGCDGEIARNIPDVDRRQGLLVAALVGVTDPHNLSTAWAHHGHDACGHLPVIPWRSKSP